MGSVGGTRIIPSLNAAGNGFLSRVNIVVNTRLLRPGKLDGIGWFAHETLRRLVRAHSEHRFTFLFDRPFPPSVLYAPNVSARWFGPPTRHPLLYRLWLEGRLPRVLRQLKADLFISTDGYLSLRSSVPAIAVVHDLNFEHHPEDLPPAYRAWYRTYFPQFARHARRVVTVSEYSRQDIMARYGVAADHVDLVYNGVSERYTPISEKEALSERQLRSGGAPYFVCVGSLHPRKNIARLLAAFDQVAEKHTQVHLVVVGDTFWMDPRMRTALRQMVHADRLVFTGRLDQPRLHHTLAAAHALVYASYYEGFGIPMVEAMRCGTPVLAARATSLPEVAGDAALYCDPFSTEDIASCMRQLLTNEPLRQDLRAKGLERAKKFTWDATAQGLWNSIARTAHELGILT
jgi:glycosyltransferase involved in cell wall biosynthesis